MELTSTRRTTHELSLDEGPTLNELRKEATSRQSASKSLCENSVTSGTRTLCTKYQYSDEELKEVRKHYLRINRLINQLYFGCGHIDENVAQEANLEERRGKVSWAIPCFWAVVTITGWISILAVGDESDIKQVYRANAVCSMILTLYNLYFGVQYILSGTIYDFVESVKENRKKVRLMRSNTTMNAIILTASGLIFVLVVVALSLPDPIPGFNSTESNEAARVFEALGVGVVVSLYFVSNLHLSMNYVWHLYARHTIFRAELKSDLEMRSSSGIDSGPQQDFSLSRHKQTIVSYIQSMSSTSEFWAVFHNIRIFLGLVIVTFYVSSFMTLVSAGPMSPMSITLLVIVFFIFIFLFGTLFMGVVAAGWYNESLYEGIASLLIDNELTDDSSTDDLREFYNSILACNEVKGSRILFQYMTLEYSVVVATVTMVIIQYAVALHQGDLGAYIEDGN